MNYIWEVLLNAKEQGKDPEELRFTLAKRYSPYMELSQENLNDTLLNNKEVEINPYYRFYSIFKDLFPPDGADFLQLRESLFHLLIHFIGENDVRQGMCRSEYYKKFLYRDLLAGYFGKDLSHYMSRFTLKERNILLGGMLKLYATGTSLELLKEMVGAIFCPCILYNSTQKPNELLIYIGHPKQRESEEKMEAVLSIFAGISYQVQLFYEYHFGIIDVDDTMIIDEIALY